MFLSKIYYTFKFLVPRRLLIQLRSYYVIRKRPQYAEKWPIDHNAAKPPEEWNGWPDGKKFALVLTHDVETAEGLDKCYQLTEIEERLGFRSSFNFVSGDYTVPAALRQHLTDRGFEIGVHGLYHDNNPFRSKSIFRKQAIEINRYLKEWGSVGFRSPSMYHDLEMLHHLDIKYDASTFDTDPFEPQPDGMGTIFPFWVPGNGRQNGYVEIPYTLPQDFLLFILMKERNIDIWKKKLDWVAQQGGMALFITHPDYMNFSESRAIYDKYPVKYYEEFLKYIKSKYEGQYWRVLPKDVARFWAGKNKFPTPAPPNHQSPFRPASRTEGARGAARTAIMIDVTIKKMKRNLNDFGVRGLFTKGLQYLLKTFYARRTYRVYRIELSAERFPENASEGVLIKLIDTGDTDAISQIENIEEWLQGEVLGILSHGLCVVAFDGPRVIGFNLVVFRDVYIPLLNLRKRLRPHQAWSEQITVLKTYRKQELASALRYHVFSELWKRGIRTFYGGTLTSNIPSLRLAAKVGFQTIADVRYLKIMNRERRRWRKIRYDSR